jgi:biopolymer transport protein ExbB/TolQ
MLIERLLRVSLLGSEWVLYLLIALSIVSFATMFERWIYFRRRTSDLSPLRDKLADRLRARDLEAAEKLLEGERAIEARVALEALRWAPGGPEAVADAVDSELARLRKELESGTNFLGTLGNNAPFVGLLGTVLGVIIAFSKLGEAGQNSSAMGEVMGGIAEALVATGVGLFVAIPAVVAYNVIQKRIGDIESGAVSLAKLVSAYLKSNPEVVRERLEAARADAPSAETPGVEASTRAPLESSADDENVAPQTATEVA